MLTKDKQFRIGSYQVLSLVHNVGRGATNGQQLDLVSTEKYI